MMNCYVCLVPYSKNIGMLVCGHYLCNDCFVSCRRKNITNCQLCEKYLNATRRRRKTE